MVSLGLLVLLSVEPAWAADPTPSPTATGTPIAGQPAPFAIVIAAEALDAPVALPESPAVRTLAQAIGTLAIYANGQLCTQVTLTDARARNSQGNIVVVIGTGAQPAACKAEGSRIQFVDRNGRELYVEMVLRQGATATLSNFAPKPANTGLTLPQTGDASDTQDAGLVDRDRRALSVGLLLIGGVFLALAVGALRIILTARKA